MDNNEGRVTIELIVETDKARDILQAAQQLDGVRWARVIDNPAVKRVHQPRIPPWIIGILFLALVAWQIYQSITP